MMGAQVTVWAALFYSFPASVLFWEAEFGWSATAIMGALTLAVTLYALLAPLFGRLVDRGLAPQTMPVAMLVGAALLVGVTLTSDLRLFYLLWALIGICMGLTLYEACFAAVTRARGPQARTAITAITLVAGFASTLAYPLIGAIGAEWGWRAGLWVMAAMVACISAPLARFATVRLEAEAGAQPVPLPEADIVAKVRITRRPGYWPLAMGFALASLSSGIVLGHLLPMMAAQGVTGGLAIAAAATVGPAQVAGRIAMMAVGARVAALRIAQGAMALLALGAIFMGGAAVLPVLVLGFAVAQGGAYGVVGILRAVMTRDVLGQRNYGAIAGAVSLPSLLAFALGPGIAAVIVDQVGYGPVIVLCTVAPLVGAVILSRGGRPEGGPA